MAWNDEVTEKQLRMITALELQLGRITSHRTGFNRRKAQMLIDGLQEELRAVNQQEQRWCCPNCGIELQLPNTQEIS
jgi:hypothetical protein